MAMATLQVYKVSHAHPPYLNLPPLAGEETNVFRFANFKG